jgi:drug/metabolite transporter (DMT)-like permease
MKLFARIGAVLSFSSFFIAGVSLISLTRSNPNSDTVPIVAVGLCLIGTAFFAGTMLWLASEKARAPRDGA